MQHETQNSKVAQHPVEFLHPLQLNSKLEVEFLSQHPVDRTLFLLHTKPWSSAIHNFPWTEFRQVDGFFLVFCAVSLFRTLLFSTTSSVFEPGPCECHSKGWFNFLKCTLCWINSSLLIVRITLELKVDLIKYSKDGTNITDMPNINSRSFAFIIICSIFHPDQICLRKILQIPLSPHDFTFIVDFFRLDSA